MIRALIDTNVVLDALASREPFRADAEKIFMLAAEERYQGFVTANSVTDIYYLIRENVPEAAAREALRHLLRLFAVVDTGGEDCEMALDSPIADYEDALAAICAARAGADCVVTRDEEFLRAQADLRIVAPAEFLQENTQAFHG
jgi:predicted nucleic acid-binding protein